VMLFKGDSVLNEGINKNWGGHYFHPSNNLNGINGDPNGDGRGLEVHTLQIPAITALQEAYIRQVIDTVNDLDNVLYEIANETPIETTDWQYHMVNHIKEYEKGKPKQHPVGMTYFADGRAGAMEALLAGPADWISPGPEHGIYDYGYDPPAADGRKVIISDTDHFQVGEDESWVWKSFARGLNPILMDPMDDTKWEPARRAMGHTLMYANRMNLATMVPQSDLASSTYCLADVGQEYLLYLPAEFRWVERMARRVGLRLRSVSHWLGARMRQTVSVDLSAASGTLSVEWFNPRTGESSAAEGIRGGTTRHFKAPFRGDAVLYLASPKAASKQ